MAPQNPTLRSRCARDQQVHKVDQLHRVLVAELAARVRRVRFERARVSPGVHPGVEERLRGGQGSDLRDPPLATDDPRSQSKSEREKGYGTDSRALLPQCTLDHTGRHLWRAGTDMDDSPLPHFPRPPTAARSPPRPRGTAGAAGGRRTSCRSASLGLHMTVRLSVCLSIRTCCEKAQQDRKLPTTVENFLEQRKLPSMPKSVQRLEQP